MASLPQEGYITFAEQYNNTMRAWQHSLLIVMIDHDLKIQYGRWHSKYSTFGNTAWKFFPIIFRLISDCTWTFLYGGRFLYEWTYIYLVSDW